VKKFLNLLLKATLFLVGIAFIVIGIIQLKKDNVHDQNTDFSYIERATKEIISNSSTVSNNELKIDEVRSFVTDVLYKGLPALEKEQKICRDKLMYELEQKNWSFDKNFTSIEEIENFLTVIKRHFRTHRNKTNTLLWNIKRRYDFNLDNKEFSLPINPKIYYQSFGKTVEFSSCMDEEVLNLFDDIENKRILASISNDQRKSLLEKFDSFYYHSKAIFPSKLYMAIALSKYKERYRYPEVSGQLEYLISDASHYNTIVYTSLNHSIYESIVTDYKEINKRYLTIRKESFKIKKKRKPNEDKKLKEFKPKLPTVEKIVEEFKNIPEEEQKMIKIGLFQIARYSMMSEKDLEERLAQTMPTEPSYGAMSASLEMKIGFGELGIKFIDLIAPFRSSSEVKFEEKLSNLFNGMKKRIEKRAMQNGESELSPEDKKKIDQITEEINCKSCDLI